MRREYFVIAPNIHTVSVSGFFVVVVVVVCFGFVFVFLIWKTFNQLLYSSRTKDSMKFTFTETDSPPPTGGLCLQKLKN